MCPQRSTLAVPESDIREACGETPLPELGLIAQVWETDLIEDVSRRAEAAFDALPADGIPEGGEVALVEEARERSDLRVLAEPSPIRFKAGDFVTPTPHEADTE